MRAARYFVVGAILGALSTFAAYGDTTTSMGDHGGEGSTPFTTLAQTPEANLFTGALSTSIPIQIPPGRKSMTPKLGLTYSSSGGPSPYGFGWDLPLGRIQRSTKWGVPGCASHTDDFVLSLPSGAAELVADPPGSSTYRPKIEQAYVEADADKTGDSWTVYDRSGMKYVFGNTPATRIGSDTSVFTPTVESDDRCHFTTMWALTHVEDPNGNSIDVTYGAIGGTPQPVQNVLYPTSIDYGGNTVTGLAHFYHVLFNYEQRPESDRIENDLNGVPAVLTLRLSQAAVGASNGPAMTVSTDVPQPGTTIRTYVVTYDTGVNSPAGYQSLLSSVQVSGDPLPLTSQFTYQPATTGLVAKQYTPPTSMAVLRQSDGKGDVFQMLMDMDGDGFVDLVQAGSGPWTVYYGSASGFAQTSSLWTVQTGSFANLRHTQHPNNDSNITATDRDTFDIDGDGIPDFVDTTQGTDHWAVYFGHPADSPGRR